ncbi:MAG TPA: nucleotide exchange factor GrpE [Candidatus Paceibacterota bacterium]|nr:nucleotide exchange factor GrpE [Candidatus Paceibacterota bacterium]
MLGDNFDEEIVAEEDAQDPMGAIKKLRERARKAEEEAKTNLDGWQRVKAEYANLKRDEDTRKGYAEERIKASLAEDLIPVLDSFEMSAKHSDLSPDKAGNKELSVLHKQLLSTIDRMGIKRFGEAGEPFDPKKHEALREVEVESPDQEHKVVSVERSGYSIGDFVIRPAQVSVGILKA